MEYNWLFALNWGARGSEVSANAARGPDIVEVS
jgi:hypothetical protein